MDNLMSVKEYDLTEITKMLLKMRGNCIRKDGDTYDDPEREAKYAALNDAITLINNPSLLKPVRHGRYGFVGPHIGWLCSPYAEHGTCNACKERILIDPNHKNYCPNCGVPMDGGAADAID